MTPALITTIAVYALLALLLISLNVFSLWKWWIKAGAIIVTAAACVFSYFAISGLLGWPAHDAVPARFSLLHTHIVEPNRANNEPGHVYLWLQEVDDHQLPITEPRSYILPYTEDVANEVSRGQDQLDEGQEVLGQTADTKGQSGGDQALGTPMAGDKSVGGANKTNTNGQNNSTAGMVAVGLGSPSLNFSPMPPVVLPDKAQIPGDL
ncbi:MAG TPA: hypothetical protein VGM83_22455 [Devosiaceae bacterium]|jgi:hypothetical protein